MSEYIYGKNTVREAINANKNIYKLFLTSNNKEIINLAKNNKIDYKIVSDNEIDKIIKPNHQGVIAEVLEYRYYSLEEILEIPKGDYPLDRKSTRLNSSHV